MSIELGDEKNLKLRQWIKRKKNSSSLVAVTAPSSSLPASSSSLSTTPQTEVFDSSSDNAISEMKEVADMGLDEMAKIFSHVEENSRLDSISTSINGGIKNTDPETSSNSNPDPTTFPTMVDSVLQERDLSARELIEKDVIIPTQDVKTDDITYVNKEYEKQDHLHESVGFYDNENRGSHFRLLSNDNNNNLFISVIKYSRIITLHGLVHTVDI